jgi:hypothetical protein
MNTIKPITKGELRRGIETTDPSVYWPITVVKNLLGAQLKVINDGSGCDMWRIEAYHNGSSYGSIMVFYNAGSNYIMIQEITKHLIPMVVELTFPEYKRDMPGLNSILMEPIHLIARELNAEYIYVHPIGKQGIILEKHFGFQRTTPCWPLPCAIVEGTSETEESPCYFKRVV